MSKRRKVAAKAPPPTIIVTVGACLYLLHEVKAVVEPFEPPSREERFIPATSFDGSLAISDFDDDDVWSQDFLTALIVQRSPVEASDLGQKFTCHLPDGVDLPVGPYIIQPSSGRIFGISKLFEDASNAFVGGVLSDGPFKFKWLETSDMIPVSSKLYDGKPTQERPLAGMRFGVKDVIDIAGLETGNGSRCYREFYPPKDSTAACIEQLIAAGAIMVGKMRCCQWCDGQDPLERLEEVTPTNPRGDGFQKPSASSSGSAAGCASYPWLDFTIGTDTGGSIRHPAGVNGLYGIRPSLNVVESSGLVCTALMDTPGLFARSATVVEVACRVLMQPGAAARPRPSGQLRYKLLYAVDSDPIESSETPKFFSSNRQGPEAKTSAGKMIENTVQKLEEFLGCKRQEVCIYDLWKGTHPDNTPEDLLEATGTIYQNVVYGQLWQNVVQPFVREYQARHGVQPFIEPNTKARLRHGAGVSDADMKKSVRELEAFADWVRKVLLPTPSDGSDEIPLLIYPQSWGVPQYRDEVAKREDGKIFWTGFSAYSISYCSGCPDFTLPIGEVEFMSKFTGSEGFLPVALSLLGPRHMDLTLLKLIKELEDAEILKEVKCGPRLFGD
ncbi:amidase signature domain-containing protein [Xylariales sp. AK1849]|nr:amidase signature domain-containing protein [Xylariales sp. AK1849]